MPPDIRPSWKGIFEGVLSGWLQFAINSALGTISSALGIWYQTVLQGYKASGMRLDPVAQFIAAVPTFGVVLAAFIFAVLVVWIALSVAEWVKMAKRHRRRSKLSPEQALIANPRLSFAPPNIPAAIEIGGDANNSRFSRLKFKDVPRGLEIRGELNDSVIEDVEAEHTERE